MEKAEFTPTLTTTNNTEKQGVLIKGRDVIMLDAPEVLPSPETPLLTNAKDIVGAINELKKLSSGEGGEDWQPPDWWIPVPEPGEFDIYILIQAIKGDYMDYGMNFDLILRRESDNEIGHGHVHCDWGDGTENDYYEWGIPKHTYTEEGQYLIHITADENSDFWENPGSNQCYWLILKAGKKITFRSDYYEKNGYSYSNFFVGRRLKYIQINNPRGLPTELKDQMFYTNNMLEKVVLKNKIGGNILSETFRGCYELSDLNMFSTDSEAITAVGGMAFYQCYGLEKIDLPNVTSIGNYSFGYCYGLKYVNMPNCVSVGNYAFQGCYNLQSVKFADGCTFGSDAFRNCYSLYPRPDGTMN